MPATAVPDGGPVQKRVRTEPPAVVVPVRLSPGFLDTQFIEEFHGAFTDPEPTSGTRTVDLPGDHAGRGEVVMQPFRTGRLRNVLAPEFLRGLRSELSSLAWHERSNDLYWFFQTDDLALNSGRHVKALRDYLSGEEFVSFMERLTGERLVRGYLDVAAQRYKRGNHLLCHDDDVCRGKLTRKIAYIIYLVDEDWAPEDGGALGLFTADDQRNPTKVVARIVPEFNSMGFFLTGQASYHTVEEVRVTDPAKERWSVTGWFYSKVDPNEDPAVEDTPAPLPSILPEMKPLTEASAEDSETWAHWISADYLKAAVQGRIQDAFLNESSVELRDFLRADVFSSVVDELDSAARWSRVDAPAHVCKYLETQPAKDSTLSALVAFLRSMSFARFLTQATSLELASESLQIRRFEHGDYTLVHDQVLEPCGLDAVLSVIPGDSAEWSSEWGGTTHYIADKDELLQVSPQPNSLSLVLRDEGTLRFVKYLNHRAKEARQDISMVFEEADEQ